MKKIVSITALLLSVFASPVWAVCGGAPINPLVDVCWECMLPIKFGGVTVLPGMEPDGPDPANVPLCACPWGLPPIPIPGISMSFWEPFRIIETVKDPWCFPTFGGLQLAPTAPGLLAGMNDAPVGKSTGAGTFAQVHMMTFPLKELLGAMLSGSCAITNSDLAGVLMVQSITELDPLWQDDLLMAFLQPEAFLFANPIASLSCIADAVGANLGYPIDPLFWCMGSWGSVYPLTGHSNESDYVQANASLAVRGFYRVGRIGLIVDAAMDPTLCIGIPTPVWVKSHYKLQPSKPVRGEQCTPIGRSGLIWGAGKNIPMSGTADNFSWILWHKKACCAW